MFFAVELAVEWWRLGMPGEQPMSLVDGSHATLVGFGELAGGRVDVLRSGPRDQILDLERRLTMRRPGPLNLEPWAGLRNPAHPNYDPLWRTR